MKVERNYQCHSCYAQCVEAAFSFLSSVTKVPRSMRIYHENILSSRSKMVSLPRFELLFHDLLEFLDLFFRPFVNIL
jgi:hypothetical protein